MKFIVLIDRTDSFGWEVFVDSGLYKANGWAFTKSGARRRAERLIRKIQCYVKAEDESEEYEVAR